eukprot:CAMPEP_0194713144 /NCGR_PEP_ID=MMETSP0296-20130528/5088_1 /TAXON_ID=39354 /ORGANISM="Heterosigma akashiwo, Strain CCMP2393" /LENGTH=73 /DNA_ID=CAMNT_0039611815 /DNA_START=106 /DNA_END=323 /DNA_ORIENTATION=+
MEGEASIVADATASTSGTLPSSVATAAPPAGRRRRPSRRSAYPSTGTRIGSATSRGQPSAAAAVPSESGAPSA